MNQPTQEQIGLSEIHVEMVKSRILYDSEFNLMDEIYLKYYKITYNNEINNKNYYGTRIEKISNNKIIEFEESGIISENLSSIDRIINMLQIGKVTPFVMNEIIDEILSE